MINLTREEAQRLIDALNTVYGAPRYEASKILRAKLSEPEIQLGITYEEANQPEPVAWMHRFIEHGISIGEKPVDLDKYPDRWMPVYKDPKPCQTCQALARTVMMEQTSHDTPPQREWVGLTDAEAMEIEDKSPDIRWAIIQAEAKLKEKNT